MLFFFLAPAALRLKLYCERRMAANVRPDLTASLPDEVLCSIISYIPSLPDRFKLAAVNTKFRRCAITELNKPIPLTMEFCDEQYEEHLNGHRVPVERWPQAVRVWAPKTQFTEIATAGGRAEVQSPDEEEEKCVSDTEVLNQVLSTLAVSECLAQVRSFENNLPCSPSILKEALNQCPKLSVLRLGFYLRPLNSEPEHLICPLDLASVVANKPLIELKLRLFKYNQQDLVKLFESLEPNTMLQAVDLSFIKMPSMNLVDLVTNSRTVWSLLRVVRLCYYDAPMQLEELMGSVLPQMPLVQRCTIDGEHPAYEEFVTGVEALFNNNKCRQQPMIVKCGFYRHHSDSSPLGCQAVNLIGQLKQVHPHIQIDFDEERLILELDNVSCVTRVSPYPCVNPPCECRFVYPVVVFWLEQQSGKRTSVHMDGYRLDRCKVNRVVTDLNICRALFAAINETGDLVVIAFEDEDGDQFYITINCAHCFSGSCIGCVQI